MEFQLAREAMMSMLVVKVAERRSSDLGEAVY